MDSSVVSRVKTANATIVQFVDRTGLHDVQHIVSVSSQALNSGRATSSGRIHNEYDDDDDDPVNAATM